LTLNFEWEEAPGAKTLSKAGNPRPAAEFTDKPARQLPRQSAFLRLCCLRLCHAFLGLSNAPPQCKQFAICCLKQLSIR
jgi:hypothetical protein